MSETIVYFLGAGASRHVDDDMPLVHDFFERCIPFLEESTVWTALVTLEWHRAFEHREPELENFAAALRLSSEGSDEQRAWLRKYADAFRASDSRKKENLETVFTRAERILQETRKDEPYQRLAFLINFLFSKIDERGSRGLVYRRFAEAIRSDLESPNGARHIIVSYNYELFLEKELQQAEIWGPTFGYGDPISECVKSTAVGGLRNVGETISLNPEQVRQNRVVVIKPHGCLSWFGYKEDQRRLVLMLDRPSASGGVTYNRDYWVQEVMRNGRIAGTVSNLEPLMVPPVLAKRRSHSFLWRTDKLLQRNLKTARTVVVIGWSLPDADLWQRRMIEDIVLHRDNQIENLLICDTRTGPAHYARFEELFRPVNTDTWDQGFTKEFVDRLGVSHFACGAEAVGSLK